MKLIRLPFTDIGKPYLYQVHLMNLIRSGCLLLVAKSREQRNEAEQESKLILDNVFFALRMQLKVGA